MFRKNSLFGALVLCQASIDEYRSRESGNSHLCYSGFRIKCGFKSPQITLDRVLETFISLSKAIMNYDAQCFDDEEVRNKWQRFTEVLISRGEDESSTIHGDDPAIAEELYESYTSSKKLFEEASTLVENEEEKSKCIQISDNFDGSRDIISEYLPHEPDYDRGDDFSYHPDEYSIEQIFKDL